MLAQPPNSFVTPISLALQLIWQTSLPSDATSTVYSTILISCDFGTSQSMQSIGGTQVVDSNVLLPG